MESGNINIKKMGIIKALLVVILSILLEGLGQVPVEILNLFSGKFETAGPYIYFGLGVVVKYYVIIILLKWFSRRSDEEKPKHQLKRKSFAYVALMIIAFRVIFDNSLILWVNNIPMPDFINRAFEELSISPIILILTVTLIAPVYEEIIFRGILLRGMVKKMNPAIADTIIIGINISAQASKLAQITVEIAIIINNKAPVFVAIPVNVAVSPDAYDIPWVFSFSIWLKTGFFECNLIRMTS